MQQKWQALLLLFATEKDFLRDTFKTTFVKQLILYEIHILLSASPSCKLFRHIDNVLVGRKFLSIFMLIVSSWKHHNYFYSKQIKAGREGK